MTKPSKPVTPRHSANALLLMLTLLAGCQTSDNPREGGLFGGIKGISTGAYEERVQEREERLKRLQQTQAELDAERTELEARQQQSQSAFELEQQKVAALSGDTLALTAELQNLSTQEQEQEQVRKDLISRLRRLQHDIDRLAEQDETRMETAALVKERDALEEEYRLLLDIYREISQ